jgi:hypothetical protein
LEERSQDTVILENIPPEAEVEAVFMVRIADGEKNRPYQLRFYVNEDFAPDTVYAVKYNPRLTLQMWVVSLLLLPPGSHILMPVTSMLLVAWMESLSSFFKNNRSQKYTFKSMFEHIEQRRWRQVFKSIWPDRVLFVAFMGILSGLIFSVLPKLRFWMLAVFWIATAICFVPAVYDWLGRNEEDDAKGHKPKEDESGTGSSQEEESKEDNDAA